MSYDAFPSSEPDRMVDPLPQDAAVSLPFVNGASLPPAAAWAAVQRGEAVLVDVRSNEERTFVGLVPGSLHVAWATGTALTRNPRFVRELEAKVGKRQPVLLLCRSGKRSGLAMREAIKAGFEQVANVEGGFEGDLDADNQRGHANGWRFHGLPWSQE